MRTMRPTFPGTGLAAGAVLLFVGLAAQARGQAPDDTVESDPYPLVNCVVMQGALPHRANIFEVGDREIRVCCENCVDSFRSNSDHWLQVVDDFIKEEQGPFYPLDTCVVDGTKLDESNRLDFVFRNRLFRVCGEACQKKLKQEPAKYFALANRAAVAKQKAGYPLTTCVVSGKPLGKDAIDHVVGNQLVRLADAHQIDVFNESPGEYLAKLREALRQQKQPK